MYFIISKHFTIDPKRDSNQITICSTKTFYLDFHTYRMKVIQSESWKLEE